MEKTKKLGLELVLDEIKSGNSPANISKKYNVPKQNVSYFVVKLKKKGCIKNIGYGTWRFLKPLEQVKDLGIGHSKTPTLTSHKKEIRGHAFVWRIQFLKNYNWNKAVKNYQKKKLTFQLMKHNKIWRTILNSRKIWLGKKGMTIYEPIDFMGRSSFEVKGKAVFEMDLLIKSLLQELNLKFMPYRFTTSREHYGIVKNELARQYNDKKEKMHIRSEDGKIWMWIDDSKGLGELENQDPTLNRQVQKYWNDHKDHNFKVDASFILKGFEEAGKVALESAKQIKQQAKNVSYHMENMVSHVGATQDLSAATKLLNKNLEKQTEIFEKIARVLEKK